MRVHLRASAIISLEKCRGLCCYDTIIREWPDGIPLTEETAFRAAELNLYIPGAAKHWLSPELWNEFCVNYSALWNEFYQKVTPLRVEYFHCGTLGLPRNRKELNTKIASFRSDLKIKSALCLLYLLEMS